MSFGISSLKIKWWIPVLLAGAMITAIACGEDTVVVQTVIVDRDVPGAVVIQTVVVTEETIVEREVPVQIVVTATPGPIDDAPAPGTPSGTLIVAWPAVFSFVGMPSLNGGRQGERLVWLGVHETANRMNAAAVIVPHLAESWTISTDGTRHTVKLRQGVQFHGGWGEMTAADWKWTADDQWQGKPTSNHGGQFIATTNLLETNVIDKYTVEFVLNKPNAFFQEYYGSIRDDVALAVYSKNRVDTLGVDKATTDLPDGGTGPYKLDKWVSDNEIVLSTFSDYWGDLPEYETIRIVQISEPSTVLAALATGEIDASKVAVTQRSRVEGDGLEVRSAGLGFASVTFSGQFCFTEYRGETVPTRPGYDPSLPWVGDCNDPASLETAKQVRLAMSMAVDRVALIDVIAGGEGRPSYVQMLQGFFADRYMQPNWIVPFDQAGAKKILADAGYPNGFEFQLVCSSAGHPLLNEFCDSVAGMWDAIGLTPKIERIADDALRVQLVAREFNGIRIGVGTGVTPIPEARGFGENPTSAFNSGYEVPGLLTHVAAAALATTPAQLDLIRNKQYEWAFDQQLNVPLIEFNEIYAVNPDKIGEWPRTPFNGHASELMDFEHLRKPR